MSSSPGLGLRAATVVVALAGLVFSAGFLQLGPSQEVVTALNTDWSCRSRDPETGVQIYQPGCKGTRDVGLGEIPISLNQAGFRGTPPTKGTNKVLLLGGSTLFGPGLGNKWEPAGLLEEAFAAQGREVDVLNLSVEGYTTTQHAIRFRDYLDKHKPKLVVLDTLSNHKMFLDLVLRQALVTNNAGHPKRLHSPSHVWGSRIDGWLPQGLRSWARTLVTSTWSLQTARQLEDLSPEEVAEVLASWQSELMEGPLALARKRGIGVALIWNGEGVANLRTLRVRESAAPARALSELTPQLDVPADVVTAALQAQTLPMVMPSRLPGDEESDLFLGDTPYYSAKGMKRYTRSLALALVKRELL